MPQRPQKRMRIVVISSFLCASFVAAAVLHGEQPAREEQQQPAPPIASSGQILGVGIGMTMKEAREKLDPLREPDAPRDEKEKFGSRAYWKLRETEFDWIMVWANRERKIVRIRAVLRGDKHKPFAEIGDLAKANPNTPSAAAWNLLGPHGAVRISALGGDGHAARISILAFDPNLPEPPEAEDAE